MKQETGSLKDKIISSSFHFFMKYIVIIIFSSVSGIFNSEEEGGLSPAPSFEI